MVDGVDIRHMDPLFLRYRTGVVLQECYLFSGTIKENIAMAAPNAGMERIIQAARIAGVTSRGIWNSSFARAGRSTHTSVAATTSSRRDLPRSGNDVIMRETRFRTG